MDTASNPLATEKIGKLIGKFAIPAIISMLSSALYNIVDQIFIGQGVGMLGNAATNVAFPLATICTAVALLIGIGSASNFNLNLGAGQKEKAARIAGCGISLLLIFGVILMAVVLCFLKPLVSMFGATQEVYPYAHTYMWIISLGMPFLILSIGASHLIRADGSPKYSMICMLSGAVLNTILDPIFIFGFNMGIAGGAWATVIGQVFSCLVALIYYIKLKNNKISKQCFRPRLKYIKPIMLLGASSCINQIAITIVQIAMNNVLAHYGALSAYGSEIPLACAGVISKVNMIFLSIVIGISQGCQPINGFNYGAKNYARVRETYKKALSIVLIISMGMFLCFQLFPRQIVSIFGQGSELYYEFSERYFRIFLMMTFINGVQVLTATFFTSVGKAMSGIILALTRQILFLLPLILFLPMMLGIDGVMYAGPISDGVAAVLAFIFVFREMKEIKKLEGNMVLVAES